MSKAKRLDLETITTLNAQELLNLRGGVSSTKGLTITTVNFSTYKKPGGGGTPAGGDWRSLGVVNAFYPGEEGGNGSK